MYFNLVKESQHHRNPRGPTGAGCQTFPKNSSSSHFSVHSLRRKVRREDRPTISSPSEKTSPRKHPFRLQSSPNQYPTAERLKRRSGASLVNPACLETETGTYAKVSGV